MLEAWEIPAENARGTVIIFHGYSAEKSVMLERAEEFIGWGYNTILVDFMGSGGSEGKHKAWLHGSARSQGRV
jgi:alpha-beta hydrolase superfamily lysophospholipase